MNLLSCVDKVPRLSISIVMWILSSDTICQLNQINTNSEAAMLSTSKLLKMITEYFLSHLKFVKLNGSKTRLRATDNTL